MEQNPKERFEDIKKAFYQSDFGAFLPNDKIEVTYNFIKDFDYLIKLVDQLDKRKSIESINKTEKLKPLKTYEMSTFIDIIKMVDENREKINEIIDFNQDSGNHIPHID